MRRPASTATQPELFADADDAPLPMPAARGVSGPKGGRPKGARNRSTEEWRQFMSEIARMDDLLDRLSKADSDIDPDGFRFNSNPFFLKFCNRIVFNPDDKGMFPGMYLPHRPLEDFWLRVQD